MWEPPFSFFSSMFLEMLPVSGGFLLLLLDFFGFFFCLSELTQQRLLFFCFVYLIAGPF
eukprot:m.235016 g.235016  ORF g.235016 m.235016 type:complete len:59 (-) comp19857_c0_seq1:70-246(-)